MKGTNELSLNQATMIEAVQLWLDSLLSAKGPTVTKVERDGSSYNGREFRVTIVSDDSPVDEAG